MQFSKSQKESNLIAVQSDPDSLTTKQCAHAGDRTSSCVNNQSLTEKLLRPKPRCSLERR